MKEYLAKAGVNDNYFHNLDLLISKVLIAKSLNNIQYILKILCYQDKILMVDTKFTFDIELDF